MDKINYSVLREWSHARLNTLKEDLVRKVNIPENAISYTGTIGSFVINPFGSHSYSFDVMFNNKEDLDKFLKSFKSFDLIDDDAVVKENNINKYYVVSGFINAANLEELQMVLKKILNGSYQAKSTLLK